MLRSCACEDQAKHASSPRSQGVTFLQDTLTSLDLRYDKAAVIDRRTQLLRQLAGLTSACRQHGGSILR